MWLWLPMRLSSCNTDKFQFVERLGRGVFAFGEDFSLRHWWASSPMAYAQMRTPFCDSESHRGALESSRTGAKEIKKQPSFLGSVVLFFGAGWGIRTPVRITSNGFQDRLVVTTSISLRMKFCWIRGRSKWLVEDESGSQHSAVAEISLRIFWNLCFAYSPEASIFGKAEIFLRANEQVIKFNILNIVSDMHISP